MLKDFLQLLSTALNSHCLPKKGEETLIGNEQMRAEV